MKKVALSLIAFMAAGAFAFGQDAPALKLSGSLNTGAQVSVIDGETVTNQYESDSDTVTRLRLNGAYENSNSGVKFRLQAKGSDAIVPTIEYAYVWSSFVDKLVTVKVGALDDGTFETAGDLGTDLTPGTGALFIIAPPVPGLKLGLDLGFDNTDTKPLNAAIQGSFTQEKLFSAQFGFQLGAKQEYAYVSKTTYTPNSATTNAVKTTTSLTGVNKETALTKVNLGFSIDAVEGLTLAADASIANIGAELPVLDMSDLIQTTISEVVGYDVTPEFNVGVVAYQYVFGSDYENADEEVLFGYSVKPNVSYKVSDVITVGGEVTYFVGNETDDLADVVAVANDAAKITVKPNATFTLSPNATVVTAFSYLKSLDDEAFNYGTNDDGDPIDSKMVLNIDFRYSF